MGTMRAALLALIVASAPGFALAGGGSLSGGSTAGHLESPSYGTIGKTSSTHVTTIKPRTVVVPAGAIPEETQDRTPGGRPRDDDTLLLERRLDCFSGPVAPDRDTRNRFMSRCPGNTR
jgi:hypothetical protein